MHLKTFAAVAALSLATFGASATTTDLGTVTAGTPMAFGGYAPVGAFNDIFTFSLPANSSSGYSVSNFLSLPAQFNTVLSTLALVSNPDGILFNADDALVSSSVFPGGDSISLSVGSQPAGDYYLNVTGLSNGSQGGIYNGAISVSAVPEPETYAMMLAGLAVMGFVAGRRGSRR